MKIGKKEFIKRFIYAASANLISLLVSVLTTLLIPKFLGAKVEEYGYLQLYLFYTSYVGFLHFGWVDGILLREGGKAYDSLDKPLYAYQYRLFASFELLVSLLIVALTLLLGLDADKTFVLNFTAANVLIMLMRSFLQYVLQATNRIREFSLTASVGRVLYLLLCVAAMLLKIGTYRIFVIADTLCKLLSLLLTMYFCKDIVFARMENTGFQPVKTEIFSNISAGIKLVFANIASMLITGIVRQGIENRWDISTFGKVSLTLSISNFFITFISAVAIVLFPTLRTVDKEKLPPIYKKVEYALAFVAFGLITLYYPLRIVLASWLPHYSDGLKYMAILFPMCFYLSKVTLLIQTYYQVLRYEKDLMWVNMISLAFSAVSTYVSIYILHDLSLAVFSILLNQGVRCVLAEGHLSRLTGIPVLRDIIADTVMVSAFIIANWLIEGWTGFLIYFCFYVGYLVINKKAVRDTFGGLMALIKKH
ncbi:MAG: hypothetical protein IJU28_05950 [Clostridia bacterium]|nr:hypothetical protein [Clostridia bacterium]